MFCKLKEIRSLYIYVDEIQTTNNKQKIYDQEKEIRGIKLPTRRNYMLAIEGATLARLLARLQAKQKQNKRKQVAVS